MQMNPKLARVTADDLAALPAPILRVLDKECYGAGDLAARVNAWLDARDKRDKGNCSHWMKMAGWELRRHRDGDDRGNLERAANYVKMAADCWPLSKAQAKRGAEIVEAWTAEQERRSWPECEFCGKHVEPGTGVDTPHGLCCGAEHAAEMAEYLDDDNAGKLYPRGTGRDDAFCGNCGSAVGLTVAEYFAAGREGCPLCEPAAWADDERVCVGAGDG